METCVDCATKLSGVVYVSECGRALHVECMARKLKHDQFRAFHATDGDIADFCPSYCKDCDAKCCKK